MGMRHVVTLACLALLACVAAGAASAAGPRYGTVSRGWVSVRNAGPAVARLPAGARQLVAHFPWRRTPTPGLPLEIDWIDGAGQRRAVWKSRTLRSDKPGTVLWTSLGRKVLTAQRGRWHVGLRVEG